MRQPNNKAREVYCPTLRDHPSKLYGGKKNLQLEDTQKINRFENKKQ
jgi:hypothetical protein